MANGKNVRNCPFFPCGKGWSKKALREIALKEKSREIALKEKSREQV